MLYEVITFIIAKAYTSDSDTKKFAQNLSSLFKEKVYVHDLNYGINTYVGVLKADDDIRGVSDITNALEVALYYSKIENTVVYYSYDIYQKYNTQISFDKQFVNTIMNEELEVYYVITSYSIHYTKLYEWGIRFLLR